MGRFKKIIGWIAVAVFIAAIPVAWATVIKDSMTYEGVVTFLNNISLTGNLTSTGNITNTGNISNTGNLTVSTGFFASGVSYINEDWSNVTDSGVSFSLTDDWNYYIVNEGAYTSCTDSNNPGAFLPTLSSTNDGIIIGVKLTGSGTSPFEIGVDNVSTTVIESTRGTISAQKDATIDAAGDVKVWMGIYGASGSTWYLLYDELS